jgi:phage FluMu protein Com
MYGHYGKAKHFFLPVVRCTGCDRLLLKPEVAISQAGEAEHFRCPHCGKEFSAAEAEQHDEEDEDDDLMEGGE